MKQQGCVGRSFVVAAGQATVDVKKKKMSNKEGKNETNYSKEKVNFDPETKNTFFSGILGNISF